MKFVNEVFQTEVSIDQEDYDPAKNQPYFLFKSKDKYEIIGLDEILSCLAVAEKAEEIPPLGISFWQFCNSRFNVEFPYEVQLNEVKENEKGKIS